MLIVDSLRGRGSPFNCKPHRELLGTIFSTAHKIHGSAYGSTFVDSVLVGDAPLQPSLVDCALYMVMCFAKHISILPEIHLQDAPQWCDTLAFRHYDIQQMRHELYRWISNRIAEERSD